VNGSTHPPNRRPHDRPRPNLGGRPCKRVQIFDPLLVPLDAENERAALIALAVLLAPATATNDHDDQADHGQEGEADL
jgi:hypothetical protein